MKDIPNYEGLYAATEDGQIWSYRSKKFLSPKIRADKRMEVILCKNGTKKMFYVHRLIALAYIPNPLDLPQINHKDENPQNNSVDNLEWCDCKYNNNYGTHNERMGKAHSKAVYCVELDTVFYGSREAERQTGIAHQCINYCCNGKQKTAGGFHWRYANELLDEKAS